MRLRIGDVLSDGHFVAALTRSDGKVRAVLEDGRELVVPDAYLLGVTRPEKAPSSPVERPRPSLRLVGREN